MIAKIKERGKVDFEYFVENIFAESFPKFISGEHPRETARFLQQNKKTIRVSARDHFKSTSMYAHVMWRILQCEGTLGEDGKYHDAHDWDAHYFSYMQELAGYHIGGHKDSIRRLIERNPFYQGINNLNETAMSSLTYTWDGVHIAHVTPQGLLSFKRGLHSPTVYVDDPFQDPENKLNPTIIHKINRIIVTNVMSIPHKDGELHIAGTAQTKDDFFFDKKLTARFAVTKKPAIISYKDKIVLWPEYMPYEELMARKSEQGRWFDQEYMCIPVSSELAYFTQEQVEEMEKLEPVSLLKPFKQIEPWNYPIIASIDIGKKKHPSHITVFRVVGKLWEQLHQEFLDHVDYIVQVERCAELEEHFGIEWFSYDATRGEFDGFAEQGLLPKSMKPVIFNLKTKGSLAAKFDEKVSQHNMRLIKDERQRNSILSVMNDLNALETPEGHGDAFFSIMAALNYEVEGASGSFPDEDDDKKATEGESINDTIF